MSERQRILVAGIGNIFLGDDGFGVEVARRLSQRAFPEEVKVVDFGIRSFDLTYALMDGYTAVILVDAASCGGEPGTLYEIEPDLSPAPVQDVETHGMNPQKILQLVSSLGWPLGALKLVGCEPSSVCSDEELHMGLSPPVAEAVEPAVALVESLVQRFLGASCA